MGKKRVIKETTEKALQEKESVEESVKKSSETKTAKRLIHGRIYIAVSYNNIMMTVTDSAGNAITWATSGGLGFKGPKKATPYAASRVAEVIAERLKKTGLINIDVYLKGVGSARESSIRSLASRGLNILNIKDVTPIPHNGPRPPKARRV
jgi:small subunit ribosomal protein S11